MEEAVNKKADESKKKKRTSLKSISVSYTHLRAHET